MLTVVMLLIAIVLAVALCLAVSRAIRSRERGDLPRTEGGNRGGLMDVVVFGGAVLYSFFHAGIDFMQFMEYEAPSGSAAPLTLPEAAGLLILAAVPALVFGYVVFRCRDRVVKFALSVVFLMADFSIILVGLSGLFAHAPEIMREVMFPWHGYPEGAAGFIRAAAYVIAHLFIWATILYALYEIIGLFFRRLRGRRGAAAVAGVLALAMGSVWAAGAVKQRLDAEKFANRSILRAVVREENGEGETAYYGIAADRDYGAIVPFDPADMAVYQTAPGSVTAPLEPADTAVSLAAPGGRREGNQLAGFRMVDGSGAPVEATPEMRRILDLGGENEHSILRAWLMRVDDLWFLQVMLNVNLWTPYELYWYNPAADSLVEMTTFDGKEVVGLEVADRAYFDRMASTP